MAYDLKAVFKIQDDATAAIRRITREMNKLNQAMRQMERSSASFNAAQQRTNSALNSASRVQRQYNSTANNTSNVINRNTSVVNNNSRAVVNNITNINRYSSASSRMASSVQSQSSALSGLRSTLIGVAGAYLGAQGAAKAFDSIIGNAARYEMSKVTVEAIFNDKTLSDSYLKAVEKIALDSPLLDSGAMLSSGKGLVAMTKDINELSKAWSVVERLMVLDPTQGTDGATFALKEMLQGDALSMVERFGLDKKKLNEIKKLGIPQQLSELDKLLSGMGITQETVNKMGKTTLGYWSAIGERASTFTRSIGEMANSKIGAELGSILDAFDSADTGAFASKIDSVIGGVISKIISGVKWLWKWREPILDVIKVVGTFVAVLAGIFTVSKTITLIGGAIAFLTSPIGLVALAITGIILGFKTLYEKSESFRNAIDGITAKASELYEAFKSGGTSGLIDSLFPPDTAAKVNAFVDGIKAKVSELMTAFNEGGVMGVISALLPPGMVEEVTSFVDTIKTQMGEVIPFIKEKFDQIKPTFDVLKGVFTQVRDTVMEVFPAIWSVIEPILTNVWSVIQRVADIATWAFNLIIVPALAFMGAAFEAVWNIIGPILEFIGAAIELAFGVLKIVWDTIIAPFAAYLMGGFASAIDDVMPIIEGIGAVFETVGSWISKAADLLSGFAKNLSSVKVPDWLGKIGSGAMNFVSKMIPGHYHGLDYVRENGYVAQLHKGEMVLTRQNADIYRSLFNNDGSLNGVSAVDGVSYEQASAGLTQNTYNSTSTTINNGKGNAKSTQSTPSISIAKLADQVIVREEGDIEKVAYRLAKLIERQAMQIG